MGNTWGGARKGAGRKKIADTAQCGFRLKLETKAYLQEQSEKEGITITECMEKIIQRYRNEHKEG